MIRKLRIQFICVIMGIVVLMLGTILAVVIHFTGRSMQEQSIHMMQQAADKPLQQGLPGDPPDGTVRLPFFAVQLGSRGQVLALSPGSFDLSDPQELNALIYAALESGGNTGVLEDRELRFLKQASPSGLTIVFSDISMEKATMTGLLITCLLIFAAATMVFLLISIVLSHWVIRPVEQAWEQQRQFMADASHELKTPLSVIMANAELLGHEDTPEADRRTFSGNILQMTYQMRALVETMLEMGRLDSAARSITHQRLDFSQLVRDAALSFQLLYGEKGLTLQCLAADGIVLNASEQHLYQLLDVLLDNALKYSTPGGTVRLELTRTGRSCTLTVASPGEPLSGEDLKNIFKRFYRADRARAMNGSYGLGLSIAEAIVKAHRGRIWAQSRDGFNLFSIRLPTVTE